MDDDPGDRKNQNTQRQKEKTHDLKGNLFNARNVFSSVWLRCSLQAHHGLDRFLLGCRHRFLFNFRLFLVILYLAYEVFK
jgi:hypothetical protein